MFDQLDHLPEGFLDTSARDLIHLLPRPSLIHLKGKRERPVFLSILLHGNEDVGLKALQALLKEYQDKSLPRSLSVFVGNVTAAAEGKRRLDNQPDYNRVWPGADEQLDTPEHAMMCAVVEEMKQRSPFLSIDLHNNTGVNPHYACINELGREFCHLAALFSRVVVYFTRPHGVQSLAFSKICPAVTVECGQTGDESGVQHAKVFLDASLNLAEFPSHPVAAHDIEIYHTVATVKVPQNISFGFDNTQRDINFVPNLDHLNFSEIEKGTAIATVDDDKPVHLNVTDDNGQAAEETFFHIQDGQLRFAKTIMPSMFTLNEKVIRQDCLGYLMERYPFPDQN